MSLRILATTDLHMQAFAYDYYADRTDDSVGLARVASLIERARTEVPNTLTFDVGDTLQGTPLGDHLARLHERDSTTPHPFILAMNAVGYDAATFGNHDFNYGLDFALAAARDASFPVVIGNLRRRGGALGEGPFAPFALLDRELRDADGTMHRLRVGVMGLTPPQVMQWDHAHLEGRVEAFDIVQTAQDLIPVLRSEGADLIVVLAHSGIGTGCETDETACMTLAGLDGVDVVLAGHDHLVFPSRHFEDLPGADIRNGLLYGTPAVMAGQGGSDLGVVDLELRRVADAGWRVVRARSHTRPIADRKSCGTVLPLVPDSPEALAPLRAAHAATLADIRRPVGRIAGALHTYFSMVEDSAALRLIARAQTWHVAQALRGRPEADLPLLSAATPYQAGGRGGPRHYADIPAGNVAARHVVELYVYPNRIAALRITGAELRDWLDLSAAAFSTVPAGAQDQPLFDPDLPSYLFDAIYGVTYEIDLTVPPRIAADGTRQKHRASRIVDLRHEGRPVTDDMEFIVATNTHRANTPKWPGRALADLSGGQRRNQDVLLDYIAAHSPVETDADPAWRLAPVPCTSVTFATGPDSRDRSPETGLHLELIGTRADGFLEYRLFL